MALSDEHWEGILEQQLAKVNSLDWVTIVRREYRPSNPRWPIYQYPPVQYRHGSGHELIILELKVRAIIDCNPKNKNTPYKVPSSGDVVVTNHLTAELAFPRSYPSDPLGWGLRFTGMIPMYPNIFCADPDPNNPGISILKFSKLPKSISHPGMVCLGAASRTPAVPVGIIFSELKNYLEISDLDRFSEDANDGGYDRDLFEHYKLNKQIFKDAIDLYTDDSRRNSEDGRGVPPLPPPKRLGAKRGSGSQIKRLGKR